MTRILRATTLGAAVIGAMAVGGGHTALAQQPDPYAYQRSDCDSRGGPPTGVPKEASLQALTGSSRCVNFSQG